QTVAQPQILTVTRGVLADDSQLPDAFSGQVFRFAHHRGESPGTEPASHLRNYAERTRMITTFSDFQIGGIRRSGEHSGREFVVKVGLGGTLETAIFAVLPASFQDPLEFVGPDHKIHFGNL